jgi:DNA replication protein DnaC
MTYKLEGLTPIKRHWLSANSNIPHRFLGLEPSDIAEDVGSFPPEINYWLDTVLSGKVIKNQGGLGTTGVGLLFAGQPGLGKTTHAVTTLMELVRRLPDNAKEMANIFKYSLEDLSLNARPIYYLTYPEFLSLKKSQFDADEDTKRKLFLQVEGLHGRATEDRMNVRVLVLDDLGKEHTSDFNDASFDEVLRARYDKGLPTIITTNKNRDSWAGQYGKAMGSFVYEAFQSVSIIGEDLRTGK